MLDVRTLFHLVPLGLVSTPLLTPPAGGYCIPFSRDFPDGFRPMTAIDLFDDSTADLKTSKHLFCSMAGRPGRFRAMMRLKTPCEKIREFGGQNT